MSDNKEVWDERDRLRKALSDCETASIFAIKQRNELGNKLAAYEQAAREGMPEPVYIIFDGPPSHESGRFVEVETADGKSVSIGNWMPYGDTVYWRLGPFYAAAPQPEPADHLATPDSHLRERIADAQARQAKGEGEPGDAELAHYYENHPAERRVGQRRKAYVGLGQPGRIRADRRQNAAGQVTQSDIATGSETSATPVCPVPAAPASTLPLSAGQLEAWRGRIHSLITFPKSHHEYGKSLHDEGDQLCDQALLAIELEQRVAELMTQISNVRKMSNIWFDYGRETMIERNKLEQEVATLKQGTKEIDDLAIYWGKRAEKAERENANIAYGNKRGREVVAQCNEYAIELAALKVENAALRHDIARSTERNSELLEENESLNEHAAAAPISNCVCRICTKLRENAALRKLLAEIKSRLQVEIDAALKDVP